MRTGEPDIDIEPSADLCISRGNVQFTTPAFSETTEITGHPLLRISLSTTEREGSKPTEMDIFVTLRHLDANDNESKSLSIAHT